MVAKDDLKAAERLPNASAVSQTKASRGYSKLFSPVHHSVVEAISSASRAFNFQRTTTVSIIRRFIGVLLLASANRGLMLSTILPSWFFTYNWFRASPWISVLFSFAGSPASFPSFTSATSLGI